MSEEKGSKPPVDPKIGEKLGNLFAQQIVIGLTEMGKQAQAEVRAADARTAPAEQPPIVDVDEA